MSVTRKRLGRPIALGIAIGLAISATAFAVTRNDGRDIDGRARKMTLNVDLGDAPLYQGKRVSLEEAVAQAGFDFPRPSDAENGADDDALSEVWVSTFGQPTVLLQYESGLVVTITQWPDNPAQDPSSFYAELVKVTGVGTFELINGNPAWLVEANAQSEGSPEQNTLDISVGRVELAMKSDMPLDSMRALAATIVEQPPAGGSATPSAPTSTP